MKVLLVTDREALANGVTAVLDNLGHNVLPTVQSAQESGRVMKKGTPDMVLVDIDVDGGRGFNVSNSILSERPVPIVLLIDPEDEILTKDQKASGALAYCTKPVEQEALRRAIELAISRFEELTILRQEARNVKEALEGRKAVEKAKTILMQRFEISEVEAFHRLKEEGASQGKKLKEVAEAVVLADKML